MYKYTYLHYVTEYKPEEFQDGYETLPCFPIKLACHSSMDVGRRL